MQDNPQSVQQTPVQFNGTGMEYFRVWIVNIALSIVTLGIYSAWAKVRTQQYFYGNTQVLKQSFQYLATGGQIFRSRIIAVVIFFVYMLLSKLNPVLGIVLPILFLFALPWLMNSGLRFNARMSSWRNVRFDFNGSYGEAFMVTFVWPLLGMITFGILMPRAVQRSAQYIVTHHSYGDESFEFTATPGDYGRVIWGLMIAYLALIIMLAVGVSMMNFVLIGIGYIGLFVVGFAIKPLLFNLYWSHVKLKGNGFSPSMKVGQFAWIFISNSFAVAFTFGLLYPWSQVRMAKFTAESLIALDAHNIDQISAAAQTKTGALGEELGEVFDVDVGFGV
jgi:uncharacterized membrane protein YjgN (DUF898 family)